MATPKPTRTFARSLACAAAVAALLAVGACAPKVAQRGAMPDVDAIATIQPKKSTKQDVERTLGSPSSINMFGEETWMYIGETTEQEAFFDRKVDERSVLLITFDKEGVVEKVESHGMEASKDIQPVERTTPTVGKDLTFLEQMMGNLNRFRNLGSSDK